MFMKLNVLVGDVSFLFGQGRSHVSLPGGLNELDLKYCRQQQAIQCRDEMRLVAVVVEQQVLEPTKHG
ncbi:MULTISPECIES: hypothetical protein [Rhizobium]|uniref:hypothetical protein n=1 Tax=Rhizobium TaxID=379 RepID=UPI001FCB489F|nr:MULTISPECIES: hypothetical protein [Rhizobium]WSH06071.1 hypothetical protein U8P72_14060 [Rhizobium johnstonii]WSH42376.1 hypothetical protein U8P77_13540 [Rhizobium johnstonii]